LIDPRNRRQVAVAGKPHRIAETLPEFIK